MVKPKLDAIAVSGGEPTLTPTELLIGEPMNDPASQNKTGRLAGIICVGWGAGAITTALMSNIFNLLVLRFATDFLGIAAGVAGILLGASKMYDAFSDPLVGAVSDNWKSPRGRRRPFLLLAAILCPLSIIALFFVPKLEGAALLGYYLAALILFATAYAIWTVPYLAMSAEMTDDYHDRSRLVSYRVNGGAIGLLLSSVGGPWLLVYLGGGREGYQGMALTIAVLILVASLICHRLTRSAPFKTRSLQARTPLAVQFRTLLGNRPLCALIAQKAFWYFGFAASQGALAYFIKYVVRLSDIWLGNYYIILPIGIVASQPIWLKIAATIEKKYASMLAMGLFGTLQLSWLLSGPTESWVVIVLRLLGLGFAAGGTVLLIQSMFNDTIELDRRRTGLRREGAFTGLFSLIEKVFSAFGVAALGGLLAAMGYISSAGGPQVQPPSAILAVSIGFAVVPFCTAIIAIGMIGFYDLSQKKLAAS